MVRTFRIKRDENHLILKRKIILFLGWMILSFGSVYGNERNNTPELPNQTLLFEENKGQFETGIMFKALDRQAHYTFLKGAVNVSLPNLKNEIVPGYQMKFLGANSSARIKGREKQSTPNLALETTLPKKGKFQMFLFSKRLFIKSFGIISTQISIIPWKV
jgi:hypothetical protein